MGTTLETVVDGSAPGDEKTYSFDEAVDASTVYFGGDRMAAVDWVHKYAIKDSSRRIYELTPDQMHIRIANEVARIEREKGYTDPISAEKVYELLKGFQYILPQGSPMAGIGNNHQFVSLSNCFVIGNESDSYGGIARTDEEQVQLMKRRGGVGHDMSHLRPAGMPVTNTALTSTGIDLFMERYSNSTREVAQDGRRGALMLTISVKHPDAERFIDAKLAKGKVTGANISVRVDDEFMRAVQDGRPYVQQFPINSDKPIFKREIDPRELWKKIIHNAWKSAEPGVMFWDTVLRESVPDCYADKGFKTVSTNPCGEIPLCVYDSCRLLAMNLYGYVENPFTPNARFNRELFREHSRYVQRVMDDIIDLEVEKIDQILAKIESDPESQDIKSTERNLWRKIREKAVQGRRTGIGVTGEGDMLAALGMRYASDDAITFSTNIHKTLALEVYRASVQMAKERGAFPIYDAAREEKNPFIRRLVAEDPQLGEDMRKYGRRNIALLTIAPTGTTSIMAQTSSGIEPAFQVSYDRRRKVNPGDQGVHIDFTDEVGDSWERYKVFHHKFETWLEVNGYDVAHVKRIADESVRDGKKAEELEAIIKKSPYNRATANDVDWVAKVRLQGAIQKWVDHSISTTINLPKGTSEDLVDRLYQTAWESGCKGVTIYVDGSREGVLLTGKEKKGLEGRVGTMDKPLEIPGIVPAVKVKQPTPWGTLHVSIVVNPSNKYSPIETFGSLGNAGSVEAADIEMAGRTTSMWLRSGGKVEGLIKQMKNIGSGVVAPPTRDGGVQSLPMAFAKALQRYELVRRNYDVRDILLGQVDFDKVYDAISDKLKKEKDGMNGNGADAPNDKESEKHASGENGRPTYIVERCVECGSGNWIREEGCRRCVDCGTAVCG